MFFQLYLNGNHLGTVKGLEHNFRLKKLYLQNNQITTLTGSCLPQLRALELLNLSQNCLKDLEGTIDALQGLQSLTYLDMSGTGGCVE